MNLKRILWAVFWLLMLFTVCQYAFADPRLEAEALLILQKIQAEKSIVAKPEIVFFDYNSEHKKKWPDGGLLYVSRPNCRPCRLVEQQVFTDPRVIAKLNSIVAVKTPPGEYTKFQPSDNSQRRIEDQIWPPYLVKINPGGNMVQWMICPTDPNDFLNKVFPKPEVTR